MKISVNWLGEFLSPAPSIDMLLQKFPAIGLEIGSVSRPDARLNKVRVARIESVEKHPNADRLKICVANDGRQTHRVVCGAPNVQAGRLAALALVGTVLPEGELKAAVIRGVPSHGMLCSEKELGLSEEHKGILLLPENAPAKLGESILKALGMDDTIIDLEVWPNRPDLLSHYGVARELSFMLGLKLKEPRIADIRAGLAAGETSRQFSISIEDRRGCSRYLGALMEISPAQTPGWMARRLNLMGLRPISLPVDITNYVLMEIGYPPHAFDFTKLSGGAIIVRQAHAGEKLACLDGKTRELTAQDLVIADAKEPVALGGIIGGEPTGVGPGTRTILLECAAFDPARIRTSSRRLGVATESSYRFERGMDPDSIPRAAARCISLFQELAGGKLISVKIAPPGRPPEKPGIEFNPDWLSHYIGIKIPAPKIWALFGAFPGGKLSVGKFISPGYRKDLDCREDISEELAKHAGYDAVPSAAAISIPLLRASAPALPKLREHLRRELAGLGFCEACTINLTNARELEQCGFKPDKSAEILNPMSQDQDRIAPTLLIGLLKCLDLNRRRGTQNVRLFEIGREIELNRDGRGPEPFKQRWTAAGVCAGEIQPGWWNSKGREVGFETALGILESCLTSLGISGYSVAKEAEPMFHPGASVAIFKGRRKIGHAGLIHPTLAVREMLIGGMNLVNIPENTAMFQINLDEIVNLLPKKTAAPLQQFEPAVRDISVEISEQTPAGDVISAIRRADACIENVLLFDLYRGKGLQPGCKAMAFRITMRSGERTLKDKEVEDIMKKIADTLERRFQARKR